MATRILVIAHQPLASALRSCMAHVFGDKVDSVLALDVRPDEAPQSSLRQALDLLATGSQDAPVLVLTDMVGATPCNVAQQLLQQVRGKLIAGVNAPMLLRAVTYQHLPLEELVSLAQGGGIQGVVEVKSN